jgi:tetratricopeptide (TPR) repeat protein
MRGNFLCENAALEDAAARAADHYRKAGWSPSHCLGAVAAALYYGPRPARQAIARCKRLLEDHAGDRASEANVLAWLGGLEGMRERYREGLLLVERARQIYMELGQTLGAAETCGFVSACIYVWMGRLDEAESALRFCCETLDRAGESALLASRAAELGDVLYSLSRFAESEEWACMSRDRAGDDDLDAQASWRGLMAKLEAHRGAYGEAETLARDAVQVADRTDGLNRKAKALLDLGDVLHFADRTREALTSYRAAHELYELKGNTAAAGQVEALLSEAPVV